MKSLLEDWRNLLGYTKQVGAHVALDTSTPTPTPRACGCISICLFHTTGLHSAGPGRQDPLQERDEIVGESDG